MVRKGWIEVGKPSRTKGHKKFKHKESYYLIINIKTDGINGVTRKE
jgi:hypothetical protein